MEEWIVLLPNFQNGMGSSPTAGLAVSELSMVLFLHKKKNVFFEGFFFVHFNKFLHLCFSSSIFRRYIYIYFCLFIFLGENRSIF